MWCGQALLKSIPTLGRLLHILEEWRIAIVREVRETLHDVEACRKRLPAGIKCRCYICSIVEMPRWDAIKRPDYGNVQLHANTGWSSTGSQRRQGARHTENTYRSGPELTTRSRSPTIQQQRKYGTIRNVQSNVHIQPGFTSSYHVATSSPF